MLECRGRDYLASAVTHVVALTSQPFTHALAACTFLAAEIGYNHYCGRMGWQMPQTEELLAKNRPEK